MAIKMNVTWKIKVNGKEYSSIDKMPSAERETYEKAMGHLADPGEGHTLVARSATIVFNGREYTNVDAMPEDVRRTYLNVMKAVGPGETAPGDAPGEEIANAPASAQAGGLTASISGPRPIAPESLSTRKLVAATAVLALLAALYFLTRG